MARTKADSYNKAAVKAPRKASVLTGGQTANVKAGSKGPKSRGNPYCRRPLPPGIIPITSYFSKDGSLGKSSSSKVDDKKPEETVVTSDVAVEESDNVVEIEDVGPSKDANEDFCSVAEMDKLDSDDAGPSKVVDEMTSGPNFDELNVGDVGPSYSVERESCEIDDNGPKVLCSVAEIHKIYSDDAGPSNAPNFEIWFPELNDGDAGPSYSVEHESCEIDDNGPKVLCSVAEIHKIYSDDAGPSKVDEMANAPSFDIWFPELNDGDAGSSYSVERESCEIDDNGPKVLCSVAEIHKIYSDDAGPSRVVDEMANAPSFDIWFPELNDGDAGSGYSVERESCEIDDNGPKVLAEFD